MNKVGIKEYIPMLAQMVGANMKVKVIFSDTAETASLDSDMNCVFPTKLGNVSIEGNLVKIYGFLTHEVVGHGRHSDFPSLIRFMNKKGLPEIARRILNIIEDPRIERAAMKVYPGAKRMLNDLVDAIQKDHPHFFNAEPSRPMQVNEAITGMLLNKLRRDELGQNCFPDPFIKECHDKIGKELTDKIYEEAVIGNRARDTAGVIESTRKILKLIQDLSEEKSPQNSDEQSNNSQSNEDQEGQGNSGDNQEGDQKDDANPNGKPKEDKKSDKDTHSNGKPKGASKAAKDALSEPMLSDIGKDVSDLLKEMIRDEVQKAPGGRDSVPYGFKQIVKMDIIDSKLDLSPECRGGSIKVSASLEELLQSRVDEKSVDSKSGRINGRRLARLKLGDLAVFEREDDETVGLDTAVYLMVDASGSMADQMRAEMANKAVVICGESLSKFDIPYGVSYFSDNVYEAKQFSENWQRIRGRFNATKVMGGTPITAAITHAHRHLINRPESRKVALIVTDGTYAVDWASILGTSIKTGVEVRFIIVGYDVTYDKTINDIRANGGIVSIAKDSLSIPATILESLKQVF